MSALRPSPRWLKSNAGYSPKLLQKTIRQRLAAEGKTLEKSSKIPFIPKCPAPTCECADMPPDLDIERSKDLYGTMAAYSEQIIVSTGQSDWKSKIEDEKDTAPWGSVLAKLKDFLGPRGRFHDPYRNSIISASSFTSDSKSTIPTSTQVILFPSFQVVEGLEATGSSVQEFVQELVVSRNSNETRKTENTNDNGEDSDETWRSRIRPISSPTILICSHHSRDSRCGVLGPLLHTEFSRCINQTQIMRNKSTNSKSETSAHTYASHPIFDPNALRPGQGDQYPVNIGMISHIGGHKWAGNLIIYIPPDYHLQTLERERGDTNSEDEITAGESAPRIVADNQPLLSKEQQYGLSPLAGKGIWYGRVEPKHVEGIVEQTIGRGQIIKELFRGGINYDGSPIRL